VITGLLPGATITFTVAAAGAGIGAQSAPTSPITIPDP
jgi:hypothetical protein